VEQHQEIKELLNRYIADKCSPEEVQLLYRYFNAPGNEEALKKLLQETLENTSEEEYMNSGLAEKMDQLLTSILKKIRDKK
jgi:hypothetical protein